MNREALILYLQNVRDLEVVCIQIKKKLNEQYNIYQEIVKNHPITIDAPDTRDTNSYKRNLAFYSIIALLVVGVEIFSVKRLINLFSHRNDPGVENAIDRGLEGLVFSAVVIIVFSCFMWALISAIDSYKKISSIEKENAVLIKQYQVAVNSLEQNKQTVSEAQATWKNMDSYYKTELGKATRILDDFYCMDIIPVQFRKLSAVHYLYDYMNSSKESFRDALFSQQIDDGIKRIEAKLSVIIEQLNDIILQQRVLQMNNKNDIDRIVRQNNIMIDSLKKAESSQKNIEEYTRLSANYNEAQAFISLATYLGR